jgi:hypothetical protein
MNDLRSTQEWIHAPPSKLSGTEDESKISSLRRRCHCACSGEENKSDILSLLILKKNSRLQVWVMIHCDKR